LLYLKDLTEIGGVSGDESRVRDFIASKIKDKVDETHVDKLGNLIALKKGKKNGKRFLLAAHMDEIGFMVTNVEDDGTLSFSPIGGVDPRVVPGKRVKIADKVTGVIGYKAIHLQKKEEIFKVPAFENLRIYIGTDSKEASSKLVNIGDSVVFTTEYREENGRATGKAFDDRAGCSVMMDLIDNIDRYDFDVYFAFLVQEEVGLRGSAVIAEQIQPDVAIVLEGTTAGDNPEVPEYKWATHIGDGPAVTFMHRGYVVSSKVVQNIMSIAQKNGIPYQAKRRTAGGTDAARLAGTWRGVPSGVISVPSRYIHSPVSMIDLNDYHNTVRLVEKILDEGEVFFK